MEKIYLLIVLLYTSLYSQRLLPRPPIGIDPPRNNPYLVLFTYDRAGNQIFRGPDGPALMEEDRMAGKLESLASKVANNITAGPVPVKDDLTVLWTQVVRDYIVSIDLLPYNAFTILNTISIKSLQTTSYVFRMGSMPYGVYYLRFNLTDGSSYTRTVTKK